MHARLLDVLHDGPDEHLAGRISNRIDINLGGVFKETIDQYRPFGRQTAFFAERSEARQLLHCSAQTVIVVDDLHCAPTKHVRRTYERRVANATDDVERPVDVGCGTTGRLRDTDAFAQFVPMLTVLGEVDRLRRRTRNELGWQVVRQLERCLTPERDNDAHWFFGFDDVVHILERQRFEVEPVARVVVGGHRLGVAVDHDGLEPSVCEREACMHTAVIELDALSNAVRSRTEDHDLLAVGGANLGAVFPS